MINQRLALAWPNWLVVPTIIVFWIVILYLGANLVIPKKAT